MLIGHDDVIQPTNMYRGMVSARVAEPLNLAPLPGLPQIEGFDADTNGGKRADHHLQSKVDVFPSPADAAESAGFRRLESFSMMC